MDEYFIGVVKDYQVDKIIFECNNKGYLLKGVRLDTLVKNKLLKLYIYFFNKLGNEEYFAFIDQETKNYFLELISISYIGPKTALKILNAISLYDFKLAIKNSDRTLLEKYKIINKKLSLLIIEHFHQKSKLSFNNNHYQTKWKLVFDKLLKLGFNKNNINKILLNINWEDSLELIISNAIKNLEDNFY